MKKIFCVGLVLFLSAVSFAQEKTITKTEFDKVYRSGFQWKPDQPRRETRTEESVFEVIPATNVTDLPAVTPLPRKGYIKSVIEFAAGKSHSVSESNSESISSKRETVMSGGKIYSREGNGDWKAVDLAARPKPEARTKTVDSQFEYKFLGNEVYNNQKTAVYAKIETSKIVSLTNNQQSLSTTKTKYWFGENGNLLKIETNREIKNDKSISRFQSNAIYESDPNIKIEIPNLN